MASEGDRCSCDDCPPDPRLTCSYTGTDESVLSVYVANAYRGDLLLSPGGSTGVIGGLLHDLDPPQHYTHMGIFVANHDLVRHCTAVEDRYTAPEYYDGSILGVSVPQNGLRPDHVQFGWPGTVTQSVEQAIYADRYAAKDLTPPGQTGPYHGADLTDLASTKQPKTRYRVGALSFDEADGFPALIVKPCPALMTGPLQDALGRVADETLKIFAHYRFYSYSDGAVAEDPDRSGPATKMLAPIPARDPATGKWADWTDPNAVSWVSVPRTLPGVCSTFVWQAVRNVNKAGGIEIKLDWASSQQDALGEAGGACRRALGPDWTGDLTDDATLDGLYVYSAKMRAKAASTLHDNVVDSVVAAVKKTLADLGGAGATVAAAIDDVHRPAFIAAASAGAAAVVSLLASVINPAVLVLDAVFAEQVIELFYDMPDDIANQLCNSFAFDCHRGWPGDIRCIDADLNEITDVDSSNWSDAPGIGRTVSPDNIHMFWDAPGLGEESQINGLYGYNEAAQPVMAVVRKPVCRLMPSTGTATIHGQVLRGGQPLAGAYVEAACQVAVTSGEVGYQLTVRSGGQYKVIARYTDKARNIILYGEAVAAGPGGGPIAPGSDTDVVIRVTEPPVCLRNVVVTGTIRVDDVYLTGVDHNPTFNFTRVLYVQAGVASFDVSTATWIINHADPAAEARRTDHCALSTGVGDADAGLRIEATVDDNLDVTVTFTGSIGALTITRSVDVAAGQHMTVAEFSLDTGGPFNDRAFFRGITVTNIPSPAI